MAQPGEASGAGKRRSKREGASGVFDAIRSTSDEYQKEVSAIHATFQKGEFEAKLQFSAKTQKARFDQGKADGEAYWQLMEALRTLDPEDHAARVERVKGYEMAAHERRLETEKVFAEAAKELDEALRQLQDELFSRCREAHKAHLARIKEIWVALDPASVGTQEIQALGHLAMTAASSTPQQPTDAR
jgi:hypothetical protein